MDMPMSLQLRFFEGPGTRHNVFFAVQPAAAVGLHIAGRAREYVGRLRSGVRFLRPEQLHMSLLPVGAFDGALPSHIVDEAKAMAGTVSMAPFEVVFDRVASFGGGALVLTGGAGIAGIVRLREALILALSKGGVSARPSKSFTPHLTMAYADRRCEFSIEPMCWPVSEFVLVDSLVGQSRHIVLGRWPLERLGSVPVGAD